MHGWELDFKYCKWETSHPAPVFEKTTKHKRTHCGFCVKVFCDLPWIIGVWDDFENFGSVCWKPSKRMQAAMNKQKPGRVLFDRIRIHGHKSSRHIFLCRPHVLLFISVVLRRTDTISNDQRCPVAGSILDEQENVRQCKRASGYSTPLFGITMSIREPKYWFSCREPPAKTEIHSRIICCYVIRPLKMIW